MSAIADVARLAGVSKSTASRALSGRGYVSEETADRVRHAAATIGYVVSSTASSLVTGRTRNVGVVIPFLNRWYFSELLEGIESVLIAAGHDTTLYRVSEDEAERRRIFDYFLRRNRVDGVLAVGVALTEQDVGMLRALGKPIVGVGGELDDITTIGIDDVAATRFVTDHLLGLGHTRIVYIGGDPETEFDFGVHGKRLRGTRRALERDGIGLDGVAYAMPFSMEGGYRSALTVLADREARPTAIVAECDEIAIGVIVAARQLGIHVPSQLSVVGIDGHPLAEMFQLTTLEQHPGQQGRDAATMLLRLLDPLADPAPARRVVFPVSFSVRGSTTGPPNENSPRP